MTPTYARNFCRFYVVYPGLHLRNHFYERGYLEKAHIIHCRDLEQRLAQIYLQLALPRKYAEC